MTITASKPEGPTGDFSGDIDVSSKLPSQKDLENVADLPVLDVDGQSHPFKTLYSTQHGPQRVLIIFIRHFFCGVSTCRDITNLSCCDAIQPGLHTNWFQNCQEYIRTLSSSITPQSLLELETPSQIVIIGCGQPDLIRFYVKETDCPFPIYADPTKKIYGLLGMTRTLSLGNKSPEYMQTSVLVNAVKSIVQELRSGRNILKGGDFYQVGGEFIFEKDKVTWCHRMRNTRDHAEIPELRAALEIYGDRPPLRQRWSAGIVRALSDRRKSWSRSRSGSRKRTPPTSLMDKVTEDKAQEEPKEKSTTNDGTAVVPLTVV